MSKPFHLHVEKKLIRAGNIRRHPENQRKSPLAKFKKIAGPFNDFIAQLEPTHVVADGNGGWYAVGAATRNEYRLEQPRGKDIMVQCNVYGNGKVPTPAELSNVFLITNTDRVTVGRKDEYKQSVIATRPDAVTAAALAKELGPKFNSGPSLFQLVRDIGKDAATRAVHEVVSIWGTKDRTPFAIVKAVAVILETKDGAARLKRRRSKLKQTSPTDFWTKARVRAYGQVGKREPVGKVLISLLLGRKVNDE